MISNNLATKTRMLCLSGFCLLLLSACWQDYPVTKATKSDAYANADSLQLLDLHNHTRTKGAQCGRIKVAKASPVRWNQKLAQAAQQHSNEMAQRGKLGHLDQHKENAGNRIDNQGYNWLEYGENLAYGVFDASSASQVWLDSTEHCQNIMNKSFTEMGAGNANGYWTVVFARPK